MRFKTSDKEKKLKHCGSGSTIKKRFPRIKKNVMTRYIVKELLLYFSISFIFFFFVFFVNQILLMAEQLLKKHVQIMDVIRLITFSLPFVVAQSAPFATMVGFLMCLGRLMSDNEVLIFRAVGWNYSIIIRPAIILGIIISLLSFFVNDYLLPLGTVSYNRLYQKILYADPSIELESNSVKRSNDSVLVIGEVDGLNISDLLLFNYDSNGNQRVIVSGSTVIAEPSDPAVFMELDMDAATVVFIGGENNTDVDCLTSQTSVMNIFASGFFSSSSSESPREMTFVDLKNRLDEMIKEGTHTEYRLNVWKLELYKKFAMPFGAIFFAVLAIPLAIIFGKKNGQTVGLIVGVLICVLYWAMQIVGQTLGLRNGIDAFWAIWIPNFVIGFMGIVFFLRIHRR
ncbi:MAG: LptF/LptG family permease [Treponemataceae bacterium]|nr:LptF/LptG family permease [Treponemataceae bacterium]